MTTSTKFTAALALALGLAATPSLAQSVYSDSASYNRDGTLNVWGAHIDPARDRGGLIGGVGNVVGGVTGAAGTIVGGTLGAAGAVVGGTVGAADEIVTGSVRRPGGYTAYEPVGRPAAGYGRATY
ncbi:hypothetical protein [Methylorubrum zatmanii]|uniref:Uncharacterized protein n=1 Tax=Methylorubrum zatmanii TaxID=29429 RepID=A0ABW1WNZ5_9HYPH|nr:hypothetical protein [Methylorubrum zatmanii]MBD8906892.1 hypothetical protein [Methylorubrum zatmanii]